MKRAPIAKVRKVMRALNVLALATTVVGTWGCAQSSDVQLDYVKYIPIAGRDSASAITTIPELNWSPLSLAWSPDGKRIAFSAASMRPFGVVDITTQKITSIRSQYSAEGKLHWSKTLNWLVLVQSTAISVYDMGGTEPQLRYTIDNKFPKLLDAKGSSLVNVDGEDYLVLAGNTNWRLDPTNPHIAAYKLKTGERKWTYQFLNPPFDGRDGRGGTGFSLNMATAAKNANGDILVAVYAHHGLREPKVKTDGSASNSEQAIWIINLTQGKEQCYINLYNKPEVQKNEYGDPWGSFVGVTIDPQGLWTMATHSQFNDVYEPNSCGRVHSLEAGLRVGIDYSPKSYNDAPKETPTVSQMTVSPDGRWLFGSSYWAPSRKKAPFRLWQLNGWQQVVNKTYQDDGAVTTAAFSMDGTQLAFGTSNRITLYRLRRASAAVAQ